MIYDLLDRLNLKQRRDGIYMSISPELRGRINFEDVRRALIRRGVVNANLSIIRAVINKANGVPTKIGEYFERYNRAKDRYIQVFVDDQKLNAMLNVRFPRQPDLTITSFDLHFKLMEANIRYGIDDLAIDRIVREKKNVTGVVVARGKPPEHGKDAQIVYKIDTNISRKPIVLDDGRVDFHQINLIKIVEKDQLLAVKIPATRGIDGISVFGGDLKAKAGKDKLLPRGMNTYLSEDQLKLYAKLSGHIFFLHNALNVENVYVVRKDVDFSTGDIHYTGDVLVFGDVKTDFMVETDGNIRIRGNVDGAEIVSRKGKVEIDGGIFGKNKAILYARKYFRADFVQEASIQCSGDVEITKYVINSTIQAKGKIHVLKGSIIGGKTTSAQAIIAREIGSARNQRTEVRIGNSMDPHILMEILMAKDQQEELRKQINNLQKRVHFLEMLQKRLNKLTDDKMTELKTLLYDIRQYEEEIQLLEEKKQALMGEEDVVELEEPIIEVRNSIFPGVIVGINDYEQEITRRMRHVFFKADAAGIQSENL